MAEGVAHCRACNSIHRLADLIDQGPVEPTSFEPSPALSGVKVQETVTGEVIRVTARKLRSAILATIFSVFWCGLTSIFVIFAATALLGLPPGSSMQDAATGEPISADAAQGVLLFMIPFVLIGIGASLSTLYLWFGSVSVVLRNGQGVVKRGIGPLTWNKRFDPAAVESFSVVSTSLQFGSSNQTNYERVYAIKAETAGGGFRFGHTLSEERKYWLAGELRRRLC